MPRRATSAGFSRVMSCPLKWIVPWVGARNFVSILKTVVLPAPLGPIKAWIAPRRTFKETSLTAMNPLNSFARFLVSRMQSSIEVPRSNDATPRRTFYQPERNHSSSAAGSKHIQPSPRSIFRQELWQPIFFRETADGKQEVNVEGKFCRRELGESHRLSWRAPELFGQSGATGAPKPDGFCAGWGSSAPRPDAPNCQISKRTHQTRHAGLCTIGCPSLQPNAC